MNDEIPDPGASGPGVSPRDSFRGHKLHVEE